MASVEDAPESMRALARKIPVETRDHMGPAELRFRVEAASALFDEAAYADGREAKRLRRDADRYLSAVSFRAYLMAASTISNEMAAARKRGDTRAEQELGDRLADFSERNPQPVMERAANGEDVSAAMAELTNMYPMAAIGDSSHTTEAGKASVAAARKPRHTRFWRRS